MLSMTRFILWSIRLGEFGLSFIYFVTCVLLISCYGMKHDSAGNYRHYWHSICTARISWAKIYHYRVIISPLLLGLIG